MARCTTCGALIGPDSDWCGQCYSPVPRPEPQQADAPLAGGGPAPAPSLSPNGASAAGSGAEPASAQSSPALPPDVLLSLASSAGRMTLLGPRGRNWITGFIVVIAAGTDALFFPYVKYMVVYGVFVSVISAFALSRLWDHGSAG
jgi:hypothetical protein